ncbi:hypothetical protein [Halorubrum sp. 2020YC2]|uniref:hypothetical protein n=1 Tax=Halorubrum sp. 2020YC2 TaxID=2836432 RepID=UPI001BE8F8E7|nr:hypothetical protein [Halorubrum sp. 2020YC2]QWC18449.1 hypothetical protein KI388_09850 [Halorubrum sp. 2020YC2]
MIDDIFEFIFQMLLELVPNAVWKVLLAVIGTVMAAVGTTVITDSTRTGAALLLVGAVLSVGSLVSLYRSR